MGIVRRVLGSINLKVTLITFAGVTAAILVWGVFAVFSFSKLKDETLGIIDREIEGLVYEYYENYMIQVSDNIDHYVDNIFDEIHLLSGITQQYFSRRDNFSSLSAELDKIDYFRDNLRKGEFWVDNGPDEPTEVFVPRYLLDRDLSIPENIRQLIGDTRFLDLIMPVFASRGTEKVQIYFQGGRNREVFRMAPWYGIGENIYAIYPEMNNMPIWDTFNPGLAQEWEDLIRKTRGDPDKLNGLLRVTPPVQDGLTGEIVLTASQPIAGNDYTTFEGTISYDIPIDSIVDYVEDIRFSRTGFAFLSQSNGNIFGINEYGREIFGLSGYGETTVDEGAGFNRLERFFSDSTIEEVRGLSLKAGDEPAVETVAIGGKEYFLVLKNLKGYQSWSPETSFFREKWILGFAVPKEEVFKALHIVENEIERQLGLLRVNSIGISAIIITLLLTILYLLINRVVMRLNRLVVAAEEIGLRRYDVELPVDTYDEVGRLSSTFNSMSREIRKNISQLSSEVDESRKNELKYFSLLESVPDPVVVFESEGEPFYVNSSFSKLFGWELKDLKEDREGKILQGIKKDKTGETDSPVFESVVLNRDGEPFDVSISSAPYVDTEGNCIGTVYNLRDITSWKRAREIMIQSEKILSFGSLASGMAHEIRNPLAGAAQHAQNISNRLFGDNSRNREAAEKTGLPMDRMHHYLNERDIPKMIEGIISSVREANRSIDNLLSFNISRTSRFKPTDIAELLEETLKVADFNLKEISDFFKISIVRDYAEDLPRVVCDSGKIQQSLINIIKNSVEAFESESTENPEIRIEMKPGESDLQIRISDNGPGMEADVRDRIFEPFFSTRPRSGGRGLGMAVTYYIIVENHGGSLSVESTIGEGTAVSVTLPLKRRESG